MWKIRVNSTRPDPQPDWPEPFLTRLKWPVLTRYPMSRPDPTDLPCLPPTHHQSKPKSQTTIADPPPIQTKITNLHCWPTPKPMKLPLKDHKNQHQPTLKPNNTDPHRNSPKLLTYTTTPSQRPWLREERNVRVKERFESGKDEGVRESDEKKRWEERESEERRTRVRVKERNQK